MGFSRQEYWRVPLPLLSAIGQERKIEEIYTEIGIWGQRIRSPALSIPSLKAFILINRELHCVVSYKSLKLKGEFDVGDNSSGISVWMIF